MILQPLNYVEEQVAAMQTNDATRKHLDRISSETEVFDVNEVSVSFSSIEADNQIQLFC